MFFQSRKLAFCFVLGIILFIPVFAQAVWSNAADFYVEPDYDFSGRNKIEAQLIKTTNQIYFYADKDWYNSFSQKNELDSKIYNLSSNFEYKIYPTLTNLLGFEDNLGVDNDPRIVVVLEPLKKDYGGYVRTGDHYLKEDFSLSNEGQIIYLNANLINQSSADFLNYELTHEFTHLIVFKQKPEVETWFQELMAEITPVILNYDNENIVLKKRAQSFLYSTEVNLRDWKNSEKDYGRIKLLGLYLKEQFGDDLLIRAVKYPSNDGIESFTGALKQLNAQNNFDDLFLNWLVTNIVNDCQVNSKYCYESPVLKDFQVFSNNYYLPTRGSASLSVTDSINAWTGKWQKLTGGTGTIKLKFTIPEDTPISKIPYIIENNQGNKTLGFLDFTVTNIQEIYVNDMGSENVAVYFIPFVGSQGQENKLYYYSFEVQNLGNDSKIEEQVVQNLLQRIAELKRKIASLQLQLAMMKTNQSNSYCAVFSGDLYYGMTSPEVKCLQQFLTNLGPQIYPEALVTGYFGPLTQSAVKRYQALQGIITTGYFGPLTRAKVNQGL
jgi:peptidoglycan hydrolase-like protein with peptidoglycan-binding domain